MQRIPPITQFGRRPPSTLRAAPSIAFPLWQFSQKHGFFCIFRLFHIGVAESARKSFPNRAMFSSASLKNVSIFFLKCRIFEIFIPGQHAAHGGWKIAFFRRSCDVTHIRYECFSWKCETLENMHQFLLRACVEMVRNRIPCDLWFFRLYCGSFTAVCKMCVLYPCVC